MRSSEANCYMVYSNLNSILVYHSFEKLLFKNSPKVLLINVTTKYIITKNKRKNCNKTNILFVETLEVSESKYLLTFSPRNLLPNNSPNKYKGVHRIYHTIQPINVIGCHGYSITKASNDIKRLINIYPIIILFISF